MVSEVPVWQLRPGDLIRENGTLMRIVHRYRPSPVMPVCPDKWCLDWESVDRIPSGGPRSVGTLVRPAMSLLVRVKAHRGGAD